jgi:hypothetical protein
MERASIKNIVQGTYQGTLIFTIDGLFSQIYRNQVQTLRKVKDDSFKKRNLESFNNPIGKCIPFNRIIFLDNYMWWGGDGLAVNMSGQHVCVLQVRVPLLPPCGYSGV